jgi:hypothetical protein
MPMAEANALRERIVYWTSRGFRVTSETPTSAQLVRPRRFNPAEFIAMPIYLIEYLGQRDQTVYVSVGADGQVTETGSALDRSRYRRLQDRPAGQRLAIVAAPFIAIVVLYLAVAAVAGRP